MARDGALDELIQAVALALKKGWALDKLHKAILDKGWSSDDAFLAIKAAELLNQSIDEAEANKSKPIFKRI